MFSFTILRIIIKVLWLKLFEKNLNIFRKKSFNPFFHKKKSVQSVHFFHKKIRTKKNKNLKIKLAFKKKITDSYDIDIFYANFVQSINRYNPQLAFSSKVFDVNLVKKNYKVTKKITRHRKKKFTPGNN